jgi:hypothetical protein
VKSIDFVFYVPDDFVPVLVEFKQNYINQLPKPVPAEQAPPVVPFVKPTEPVKVITEPNKPVEQPNSPPPLKEPETSSKKPGLSNVGKSIVGDQFDENQ